MSFPPIILASFFALHMQAARAGDQAMTAYPIKYWVAGSQHTNTIVLIHGFNDSHKTWDPVIAKLAVSYRVITYDQPGHGGSPSDGHNYSPQHMSLVLKNLLDHLKIDRSHIVGHSMGGRTALAFAATYPSYTQSLIVEDMGIQSSSDANKKLIAAQANFDRIQRNVPNQFSSYGAAWNALTTYYSVEETLWILSASETDSFGRVVLGNRPEVTSLYLWQGLAQNMTAELRGVRSKMIFFAADPRSGTAVLTADEIAALRRMRPDVQVDVFPHAAHTIHRRPEFVSRLLKFLGR